MDIDEKNLVEALYLGLITWFEYFEGFKRLEAKRAELSRENNKGLKKVS